MITYGQKGISLIDFEKQVKKEVTNAIGSFNYPPTEIRKIYKKGYSIDDAVSYFILKY